MFLDNFHYSVLGTNEGNRVVFIHGLMAFSANWRKIASRIQDQFQCLVYDQRGHGRSFKPAQGYSPEIFAQDLDMITDELGWSSFHLVGHSMGGRNAIVFADLFPEKIRSLTIEDMGPEIDREAPAYYQRMLENVPTPFASRSEIKSFFAEQFGRKFISKEDPAVLASFLQANIEEVETGDSKGQFDWRFSKNAILEIVREGHLKDRWDELSRFRKPVLLVRGERSHVLTRGIYEKMLKSNPIIHGVEIKGAGHWIHYEKYEEFTRVLREFLGKN